MKAPCLIPDAPSGLRERRRADGTTRIWWEPPKSARELGFQPVELDENRLTWSRRQAEKLNADLVLARKTGQRMTARGAGRTIEALIETYRKSLAFTGLAPKTQTSYQAHFRLIIRKWGAHQVRDFSKPVMRAWYETIVSTTSEHMAVGQLRAMSLLFSYAELIGWRAEGTNPCLRLKMRTPKGRSRSASWAEVDALVAAADRIGLPSIGTAVLLSLLQGQRQTDVIAARCGDFSAHIVRGLDGKRQQQLQWTFVRSKRGNAGALWVHEEVAPRLRPLLQFGAADRSLLRDEETGADYDEELFARRWRKVRDAAIKADKQGKLKGLSGLQYRDLRRTFGIMSRRGGATKDDTADVLGNSAATNPQLAEIYMPAQLDTASRAVAAIRRPAKKGKTA